MKWFLVIYLGFVTGISISQMGYPEPETLINYDLKGPVRQVIFDDNCKEPGSEKSGMTMSLKSRGGCYSISHFNKFGYLTEQYSIDELHAAQDTLIYEFIEDTLLSRIYTNRGSFISSHEFSYDNQRRLTELNNFFFSGHASKSTFLYDTIKYTILVTETYFRTKGKNYYEKKLYSYDQYGNLLSKASLDTRNNPFEIISYEYNRNNQITSKCVWKQQPKKKNEFNIEPEYVWTIYRYDNSGNMVEKSEFIELDKQPTLQTIFIYNESNLLIERRDTGFIRKWGSLTTYEYNNAGRQKLVSNYNQGKLFGYTMYDYDDSGNLILEVREERTHEWDDTSKQLKYTWKTTRREEFEYDHHNNWIKKYYTDWGGIEKIATREISYYK